MSIREVSKESVIPYANIHTVTLCKISDSVYKTTIGYNETKVLVITNQYVADNGGTEDRSRVYSTFIRVLHFHLKDKSKAIYKTGCSKEKLWHYGIAFVVGSFLISLTVDFLGFRFINPYVQAIALAALLIMIMFLVQLGRLPKEYTARNIPLELLPALK